MHFLKAVVLSGLRPFLPARLVKELEKPWAQHRYEWVERPKRLVFFGRLIKPGELCFDVGAHAGWLSDLFLELGARVVAIEPQPECVRLLRSKYGDKLLAIVEKALSAQEGEATLYIADETLSSTLSTEFRHVLQNSQISEWFRARTWKDEVKVATTTLDRLIKSYGLPAFCKIDVEGFEYEVVKGLSQPIGRMSLEYTGENLQPVLSAVDHLESMAAYKYNFSKLSQYQLELDTWCCPDELRQHLHNISSSVPTGDIYAVAADQLSALGLVACT